MLAVSGGPDSVALMALAAESRSSLEARGVSPHVVTVDHGLRAASAFEAETVARLARALGLPHEVRRWDGAKPSANLQGEARAARYALLGEAARTLGAPAILTAHHQDDQIETHGLAAARRAGDRGLAGMRPAREIAPDLHLLRPFLGVPGARLRATAADRGLAWFDDPSNGDGRFARVRLRLRLAADGFDRGGILDAIAVHAARRDEEDRRLGAVLGALAQDGALAVDPLGVVRLRRESLARVPPELRPEFLGRILRASGGSDYPPLRAAVLRLLAALERPPASGPLAWTLGGVRIARGDPVVFTREFGRNGPPARPFDRRDAVADFDRRFEVSLRQGSEPVDLSGGRLVPFGAFGRGNAAQATLPALVGGQGRLLGVPDAVRDKAPQAPLRLDLAERVSWRLGLIHGG